MIIGEQKQLQEIVGMLAKGQEILLVGCRSCVAVCLSGGEAQVGILAEALSLYSDRHDEGWTISEATPERTCEKEWVEELAPLVLGKEVILCMACGVGAQVLQERYPTVRVLPALNTTSMGAPVEPGVFMERCGGCGDCVLHLTGGICPVVRCAKSLLNGPCGGSQNGRCEIGNDTPCAWEQIIKSLEQLGRSDLLETPIPPKDWRPSRSGGPRRSVRPEAVLNEEQKRMKGVRP